MHSYFELIEGGFSAHSRSNLRIADSERVRIRNISRKGGLETS